ncbi:MAG: chromate efflux transporter [Armatimonadetes bacterium]|nr:chromate efflux transporter [Armatimonadota bacterium]
MLWEIARIFLRLGAVSFGGPLAHIALMRSEFVERRQWLSDQQFLDLNGAVNLIPGPNSTELAMHIGHKRAGNAGLWVAGACFIFPALVLVLILSALYAKYGTLPQSRAMMWGISPVVVAIVGQALWKFAPAALKNRLAQGVAVVALLAAVVSVGEVPIIFAAAALGLIVAAFEARQIPHNPAPKPIEEPETPTEPPGVFLILAAPLLPAQVSAVFWSFLKIGSVIYGSGYVLLAYMRAEFVEKLGLISDRQLLDAVAVGQMTPGPLFTSATFVGWQIGGLGGALAATAGIFLPSFVFVMILARFLGRLSGSPRARTFLDCVNAASFALMVVVTMQLARAAFLADFRLDGGAIAIFVVAALLLWKTRWNSALWLALGALVGLVLGPR